MDMNRMTIKLQEALQTASSHAMRRSHQGMDVEHLLLACLEQEGGIAPALFEQAGVSLPAVRQAAEQALGIDRLIKNNPRPLDLTSMTRLMRAAYAGDRTAF